MALTSMGRQMENFHRLSDGRPGLPIPGNKLWMYRIRQAPYIKMKFLTLRVIPGLRWLLSIIKPGVRDIVFYSRGKDMHWVKMTRPIYYQAGMSRMHLYPASFPLNIFKQSSGAKWTTFLTSNMMLFITIPFRVVSIN